MTEQEIQSICRHMNLGTPEGKPEQVFGGLIHKMWRIKTQKGFFAIKELSKQISFDDSTKKAYEHSEEIARRYSQAGLPAIAALTVYDHALIEVNQSHFLCYPWLDGKTLAFKDVRGEHRIKMAKMLACIHKVSLGLFGLKEPHFDVIAKSALDALFEKANRSNCPYVASLNENQPLLLQINYRYTEAILALHKTGLISHSDLDPKNVMWDAVGNPHLIDWESARPMNITHDVITLALDWSGLYICSIDLSAFCLMLKTYQNEGGTIEEDLIEDALFAILGNSLNWLSFNIRRSLEKNIDQSERLSAISQVSDAIKNMVHLQNNLAQIQDVARLGCKK